MRNREGDCCSYFSPHFGAITTESGTLVVPRTDPVRPESAIQLWVDGRIIHVASHRRGPVVNLSHLHNRVLHRAHALEDSS